MMLNCLIVEDEIAGQIILTKKLKTFFPECKILAIIDSKDRAIEFLQKNAVDIVFLDVQLKGGLGIEVLTSVEITFETIMITAFKEYAIDALNSGASYYLLKPIRDEDFVKAMETITERLKQRQSVSTILVSDKNKQIPIQINDIIYFKSEGAYSHITTEYDVFLSSKSIGYYEKLLSENFLRTHHSYLVNKNKIVHLIKGRSGILIMSNNDEIPVAQRRLNDFSIIFNH